MTDAPQAHGSRRTSALEGCRSGGVDRRAFCIGGTLSLTLGGAARAEAFDLPSIERKRVVRAADAYLERPIRTIVAVPAPRSSGRRNEYYSEADYWWPDAKSPGGPYVRRDGYTNPDKFDGHRDALMAFGVQMPALTAAWKLTRDPRYGKKAADHLRAWFADPATRMAPHLRFAQAIIGVNAGRAIGIIDTLQIVEVAQAIRCLEQTRASSFDRDLRQASRAWFADYLAWLTTSAAGVEEAGQRNNHGSCWLLQVSAFALVVGDEAVLRRMRDRLVGTILPSQIAQDGSQPLELARTKPYSYSLFNLDVLVSAYQLLVWSAGGGTSAGSSGQSSIRAAIGYMAPFIQDKRLWPHPRDVQHFDDLPVRQPSLLFGGIALNNERWLRIWSGLDPDPTVPEVVRNYPVRQPLLWL